MLSLTREPFPKGSDQQPATPFMLPSGSISPTPLP